MKIGKLVKNCLALYGGVMLVAVYYYYKQEETELATVSFKKSAAKKGLDILMPDAGGKESWTFEFYSKKRANEFCRFIFDELHAERAVTVADVYDHIGRKAELKDQTRGWTYFDGEVRRSKRRILDKWYVCFDKPKKLVF